MAFIPVPNTAQVEVVCRQDGQIVENVYHFEQATPWTEGELDTLIQETAQSWDDNLSSVISEDVTVYLIRARSLESDGAPALESAPSLSGANTTGPLPMNCTVAIKWVTGLAGRSFRGRTYHVGLCSGQIADSHLTPTAVGLLIAAYNGFQSDIESGTGSDMVVVSRISGGVPRTTGLTTIITGATLADDALDSQRRRLPTRGT